MVDGLLFRKGARMQNLDNFLLRASEIILGALKKLDEQKGLDRVLFIQDDNDIIIGSLTDGDIRRALIKGAALTDVVSSVMQSGFQFITTEEQDVIAKVKRLRELNLKVIPVLDKDGRIIKAQNLSQLRSILPLDAVLMAGGKGERLRPLTEKTPKPLLPVGDKCIIDHNIDRLISYGVEHISVTCNYLKEQLYEHFEKPRSGVKVDCVTESKFLGTIGSIKFVETFYNDTILVMNSDLFTDINYEDFYLHFKEHNADMSVAAVPYTVSVPYGIMDLDGRNLKGMIEKPTYNYYANAGIYLVKRSMLDLIPEGEFFHATHLMDAILKQGGKIIRFPINGTWIDIGNPQEFQKANELVKHIK